MAAIHALFGPERFYSTLPTIVRSRGGYAEKEVLHEQLMRAPAVRCEHQCCRRCLPPMPCRICTQVAHSARWSRLGCARETLGRQGDGTGGQNSGWPESEGGKRIGGRHRVYHGEGRSRSTVVGSKRARNGDGVLDFGVVGSRRWVWRRYGAMFAANETQVLCIVRTANIAYIYCISKNARKTCDRADDDSTDW